MSSDLMSVPKNLEQKRSRALKKLRHFLTCFLLEQHAQRRDEDMRGHLGGGSDQPDQVAVVVVGLPAKNKAMKP